jgi:hypothetical protein
MEMTGMTRIVGKGREFSTLASVHRSRRVQFVKQKLFRLTTGIAALYHLVLGAALLVLPEGAMGRTAALFLGMELEFDPRLLLIGRFVAAYILAFGVMLALLCWRPVKLRALLAPALVLFGIRLMNKLLFLTTIEQTFGVTRGRSVFAMISLALIFGVMAWTRPSSGNSEEKR